MDVDRFLQLPATSDGRRVIKLMADPSMVTEDGTPAGFVSLVDSGANLRTFQVIKAEDLVEFPGAEPTGWLVRFLQSLGLGGLATKLAAKSGDGSGPLTFDAAMTAEQLRRTRWDATDALWDVIENVLASPDVEDKIGAIRLALGQFSATVIGLVQATAAVTKAEDRALIMDALAKPGTIPPATPIATTAAKAATPSQEDPAMTPEQIAQLAQAAAQSAVTVAKAAGLTDPAKLAQIGAEASAEVYKAAVMGPAQPAMPTNTLQQQMRESGGMGKGASDPMGLLEQALTAVRGLATKVEELATKVERVDHALNGHGEGETREAGALELATKAAELAATTAETVAKIQGTPTAPHGGGDPADPTPETVTKRNAEDAVWAGSPLAFTSDPA